LKRDTGVPPVNHAQDARATIKLTHYDSAARIDTFINRIRIRATRASLAWWGRKQGGWMSPPKKHSVKSCEWKGWACGRARPFLL